MKMAIVFKALGLIMFPIKFLTEQPNISPTLPHVIAHNDMVLNHSVILKTYKTRTLNFPRPFLL